MEEEVTLNAVATARGFYGGHLVNPDTVLTDVPVSKFSPRWMKPKTKADEKKAETFSKKVEQEEVEKAKTPFDFIREDLAALKAEMSGMMDRIEALEKASKKS